jgi:opacity protein-like surface antigen
VEETGDTTVRRGREPYYRNRARLEASYQFGREDRVYAGFLYGLLRNDDDQVQDNDEYRPSVGLDYWFSQKFGGQFFGEFTRGEFSRRSDFVGEPTSDFDNWLGTLRFLGRITRHVSLFFQYDQAYRDFDNDAESDYIVYAPSAGFTYDITEDMYLRLGLGYYWQDFDGDKNQEDPFINGEISKTWNFQRGLINLIGLSGITQNDFGAQDIGFEQFAAIRGRAEYNFTRQIAGDIGAYYRYGTQPPQTDDTNDDLTTNRYQATAGISYVPTRWMNIRLGYEFNKFSSSEGNLDDYTENRVLLTISLEPDQPWRF